MMFNDDITKRIYSLTWYNSNKFELVDKPIVLMRSCHKAAIDSKVVHFLKTANLLLIAEHRYDF